MGLQGEGTAGLKPPGSLSFMVINDTHPRHTPPCPKAQPHGGHFSFTDLILLNPNTVHSDGIAASPRSQWYEDKCFLRVKSIIYTCSPRNRIRKITKTWIVSNKHWHVSTVLTHPAFEPLCNLYNITTYSLFSLLSFPWRI